MAQKLEDKMKKTKKKLQNQKKPPPIHIILTLFCFIQINTFTYLNKFVK